MTYLGVTGVYHDRIEGDTLFGKAQCEFNMIFIRRMVKMNSDWHRGRTGTVKDT